MVESLSNGLRCRHFVGIRCEKLEKFSNNYFVPIIMGVFWQTLIMKNSHLALTYDERIPSGILDRFCVDIEATSLDFRQESVPANGPQSSLEAFAFAAIAFFLFKSYFDGFMKEAGKDHYLLLGKGLKKIWKQLFGKNDDLRFVVLTTSGEMKTEYSLLFSIYAEIDNGRRVKLLIREGCSKEEYDATIDAFLNLIESYYFSVPYNGIEIDLDSEIDYWGDIFVEFNPETRLLSVLKPIEAAATIVRRT